MISQTILASSLEDTDSLVIQIDNKKLRKKIKRIIRGGSSIKISLHDRTVIVSPNELVRIKLRDI